MIHAEQALLPSGWAKNIRITIQNGLIHTITKSPPLPTDTRVQTLLPALPNLHSHAFQRALAGRTQTRGTQADSFWTWRTDMYRLAHAITPDDAKTIAAMAYMEMLESGFARVGEFHYLHNAPSGTRYDNPAEMAASLAAAAEQTGIALTLLPVFYAHANFGGLPPTPEQRRFTSTLDSFATLLTRSAETLAPLPDARLGLAPHSLRAVTPEELAALTQMTDGPLHIHAAEQTAEVESCRAWSNTTPVAWLLANAEISPRWTLIHATHMTPEETESLARSGATVALCPVTEADLGDGIFPLPPYRNAHGAFGIGTDSNIAISAADELRLLEYTQRLTHRARNIIATPQTSTGRTLLNATLASAHAIGPTPTLAQGAPADLLSLATSAQDDQSLDHWIFAKTQIQHLWRHGQHLVQSGRHIARDRIEAAYTKTLARLA